MGDEIGEAQVPTYKELQEVARKGAEKAREKGSRKEEKPEKEPLEAKLATKEGDSIVAKVKEAVFEELDRAYLEGTATKEQVELQKKHIEVVIALTERGIEILRENGFEIPEAQGRGMLIDASLHDVLKIVPERTRLVFAEEIEGIDEYLGKLNEFKEGESFVTRGPLKRALEQLEDSLKEYKSDLGGYQEESLEHSGIVPWRTKLLLHGEDSALWAEQLLKDMGFSEKFIEKTKKSLLSHMPMPWVTDRLAEQKETRAVCWQQARQALEKMQVALQGGDRDSAEQEKRKAVKHLADFKRTLLPKHLSPDNEYPEPQDLESAVLFAADLLAPVVMAGSKIDEKQLDKGDFSEASAGCLDRYIYELLMRGSSLRESFDQALRGIRRNVGRLKNPPDEASRSEAAQVERILGRKLGEKVLAKIHSLAMYVGLYYPEGGWVLEDAKKLEIGGKRINRFEDLEVWNVETTGDSGGKQRVMNVLRTMGNYYRAVRAYRKAFPVWADLSKIENR